ncbi:Fur family transcriptional regulator [Phytomonospora sp. NPDC050363]|uniref:Fur family transcriptional regulator n=1 Tax=Phytomonospora sp. NPDC050363 TaxID=3155642 RepID=UPI0033EC67C1
MDGEPLLRSKGLRVTKQRLAVLEVLTEGGHPEVDEIINRARPKVGSLSTQAAYDVLATLTGAGLARRIEPAGHNTRYEARTGDNHHHAVCRQCGHVEDIDCAVGTAPCLHAAQDHGYVIDEAEVTYWGLCGDCQGPRG